VVGASDEPLRSNKTRKQPPVPRRADWQATRVRILSAASSLFASNGYARTSTVDLAEAAGVAETTLFRHFPTKAQLFEQAVILPFRQAVHDLSERRRQRPTGVATEDAAFDFYDEILVVVRGDARLLIASLAVLTFEGDSEQFSALNHIFRELLDYIDEVVAYRAAERKFHTDPKMAGRIMLSMALGVALGERLLFEPGTTPSTHDLAVQMAKFSAYGLPGGTTRPS
jgi:AcrR family transcriptional regulator